MALKATIFKANLQIADMDRQVYGERSVTIARHPSETDERMMVRLLAYALNVPKDERAGALEFAKGLWDPDEPELWQRDLTGEIVQWIEVGQPDEKRLMKASPRAGRVIVYAFAASTPIWWSGIETRVTRARNLHVWQIESDTSQALAALAQRTMQLQVTVQDGSAWLDGGSGAVEITPRRLYGTA